MQNHSRVSTRPSRRPQWTWSSVDGRYANSGECLEFYIVLIVVFTYSGKRSIHSISNLQLVDTNWLWGSQMLYTTGVCAGIFRYVCMRAGMHVFICCVYVCLFVCMEASGDEAEMYPLWISICNPLITNRPLAEVDEWNLALYFSRSVACRCNYWLKSLSGTGACSRAHGLTAYKCEHPSFCLALTEVGGVVFPCKARGIVSMHRAV